jgi:hypothetical protein
MSEVKIYIIQSLSRFFIYKLGHNGARAGLVESLRLLDFNIALLEDLIAIRG